MQYLIIRHLQYKNMEDSYRVMDNSSDSDKAHDMLQGYNLIEKEKDVVYSILKYETPSLESIK